MGEKGIVCMPREKVGSFLVLLTSCVCSRRSERAIETIRLLQRSFSRPLITFKAREKMELFRSLPAELCAALRRPD